MSKFVLTEARVAVLKSYGWRFLGKNPIFDPQWRKYAQGICIATFGGETWGIDLTAARLATMRNSDVAVVGHMSQSVVDLLEGMGWEWTMTCHDTWGWAKFSDGNFIGHQGSSRWEADLYAAKQLAGEGEDRPRVWKATLELRYMLHLPSRKRLLEQKWLSMDSTGRSEWREVPTVNDQGVPFA